MRSGLLILSVVLHSVLLLLTGSTNGQETPTIAVAKSAFDFGDVAAGKTVEHRIKITNRWSQPLELDATASAGPFKISLANDSIAAGESTELICSLIAQEHTLGQRKVIATIRFSDGKQFGENQISLQGTVRSLFTIEPSEIGFGQVEHGTEVGRELKITVPISSNLQLEDVRSQFPHIRARIDRVVDADNQRCFYVQLHLLDSAPSGKYEESLRFVFRDTNSSPLQPALSKELEVNAEIHPAP